MKVAEYRDLLDGLRDAINSWKSCVGPFECEAERAALRRYRQRVAEAEQSKRLTPRDLEKYRYLMAESFDIIRNQRKQTTQ